MRYLLVAAVCVGVFCAPADSAEFEEKWIYFTLDIQTPELVDIAIDVLRRAKEAGVTHLVVTSWAHGVYETLSEEQRASIEQFKDAAADLDLTIVPLVFPTGYGGRYLGLDNNLAAGLPVKNAPFIVTGSRALPDLADLPHLQNGSFDRAQGHLLEGWLGQRWPGEHTFVDTEVRRSGAASLKITNLEDLPEEAGRTVSISQRIEVEPFRHYLLKVWIKTEDLAAAHASLIYLTSGGTSRRNSYVNQNVASTQHWTLYTIPFNTLEATEITLSINVSRAIAGTVWFDEMTIQPAGLQNVLRRDATPLTVTDATGAIVYEEGVDFAQVVDPNLNPYSLDHAGPAIEIPEGSRIGDKETILVSWYHPTLIYNDQVNISINDPKVFELMEWEMRQAVDLYDAPGYFMNVDEIRVGGWEKLPGQVELTPGEMLADYTTRAMEIMERTAPEADVYVWSDMYTPHHNARPFEARNAYYFLVNGNWDGSWETLPSDVIIMNWYAPTREATQWWADRGHKQILCGYYDGPIRSNIQRWMNVSERVQGVIGMMYTTWQRNFDHIEEFFRLLDEYPAWVDEPDDPDALGEI